MLLRLLAEDDDVLPAAAAKSLKEFCLANSLKADSNVHGAVVSAVEMLASFVGD